MKRLTESTVGTSVNRLSKLQKWVLIRAYQHYCEDHTQTVNDSAVPEDVNRLKEAVDSLRMVSLTQRIKGGAGIPEMEDLEAVPLPSNARHILTAQIVGHILGLGYCDGAEPGEPYDGYRDWRRSQQFFPGERYHRDESQDVRDADGDIETYGWKLEERYSRAAHNSARASASRCMKRLAERGLVDNRSEGLRLSAAGVAAGEMLTGIKPDPRCWETVNYSKSVETVNRLIEGAA